MLIKEREIKPKLSCAFAQKDGGALQKLRRLNETGFEYQVLVNEENKELVIKIVQDKDSHSFPFPRLADEDLQALKKLVIEGIEVYLGIDENSNVIIQIFEKGTLARLKELARREKHDMALKLPYVS